MKLLRFTAAAAAFGLSAQVLAAPLVLYPVQTGAETERYRQGMPTLDLETDTGAIQITPLGFDHGHVTLGIGVYNKTVAPANFGIENISVSVQGQKLAVFTRDDLEQKAKTRAMWTQIGMVALTGVAAGVAAGAHSSYHYSSHGNIGGIRYTSTAVWRDNTPGVIASTQLGIAGGVALQRIQDRLDYTLDHLATEIVQTTTIDPNMSYGGRIVLDDPENSKGAYDLAIMINWNGRFYPFTFRVTHKDESVPPAFVGTPTRLTAAQPAPAPVQPAPVMLASAQPAPAYPAAAYAAPAPVQAASYVVPAAAQPAMQPVYTAYQAAPPSAPSSAMSGYEAGKAAAAAAAAAARSQNSGY